ncbi:MAG: hypothetical protein ACRC0Y_04050 [Fusobacteriaceae bacterium]
MAKNSLNTLIKDLEYVEKNFNKIVQSKYDDVMACLMTVIGRATAYDTGVTRGVIKNILEDLGRGDLQSELEHSVYNFWHTKDEREKQGVSYSFSKSGDGKYSISITDYGFYNQNTNGKVSDKHPRKDSRVIPNQVDYGMDILETGSDPLIEKAFAELERVITKAIDGVI